MTLRRAQRPLRIGVYPDLKKNLKHCQRYSLHGEQYRLLKLLREYEQNTPTSGDSIPVFPRILHRVLFLLLVVMRTVEGMTRDKKLCNLDDNSTKNNDNRKHEIIEIEDDDEKVRMIAWLT